MQDARPTSLSDIAVLIPAWQPEPALVPLALGLVEQGIGLVVLVDDGSRAEANTLFAQLQHPRIELLRHAVNLGKGRALKTGFNHLLAAHPTLRGVVTADADGQHTLPDILAVAAALLADPARPVLGCRTFARDVPLRSRFGNTLTRRIFRLVTGAKLQDTQTGLRGLPLPTLPDLMRLDGERYEYEMTVLAHLCREGRRPVEVPIQTVYIDNNRSSHFDPIRDSMRIYFVLARFYFSSLLAAAVDFIGFSVAFALTHNVAVSVATGRLSSLLNFALNRRFVFHNQGSITGALWRYYLLVLLIAGLSYGLIWSSSHYLHWNVYAAKILFDVGLSFVSFSVQRTFVFRRPESASESV